MGTTTAINAGAFILSLDAPAGLGAELERRLLANMAHGTVEGLYVEVPRSIETVVEYLYRRGLEVRAVRRAGMGICGRSERLSSAPLRPRTNLRNRLAAAWLPTLGGA